MNMQLFSVRFIVSSVMSKFFSKAIMPLIVIGCLNLIIFTAIDTMTDPILPTMCKILRESLGLWSAIVFLVITVGVSWLALAFSLYMFVTVSLYIVGKEPISWQKILPSWIVLGRFCKFLPIIALISCIRDNDLFLIPVIFYVARFGITPYCLLETDNLREALKKSWNVSKGCSVKIFTCAMLILIISRLMIGFTSGFTNGFVRSLTSKGLMHTGVAQLFYMFKFVFISLCLELLVFLLWACIYRFLARSDKVDILSQQFSGSMES